MAGIRKLIYIKDQKTLDSIKAAADRWAGGSVSYYLVGLHNASLGAQGSPKPKKFNHPKPGD